MFTIQYEAVDGTHATQTFDSKSRVRLALHLASFHRPIMAIYEGSMPITKAMWLQLRNQPGCNRYAREFINSPL